LASAKRSCNFAYDLLGRQAKETTPQGELAYESAKQPDHADVATGRHLNHKYYGSDRLHQLNLDGLLISGC
jgi:hypothetical protein